MTSFSENEIHSIIKSKIKSNKYELLNYKLKPLPERIGYLRNHAVLKVVINKILVTGTSRVQQHTFFVKSIPTLSTRGAFLYQTDVFNKEIFINQHIFQKIKECNIAIIEQSIPACYFYQTDRVLISEYLAEQGFRVTNKHQTIDYDTALVVLKSLAKLHASVLIYEAKKSKDLGRIFRLGQEFPKVFAESCYIDEKDSRHAKQIDAAVKGVLRLIDLFKHPSKLPSGKDFKTVAKACCYKIYELVKPSTKHRNVICHGDLWTAKFLVKFDANSKPIACKVVDFKIARYCPPAQDVMTFLHLTTSREFRQSKMYELIGLYYATLETDLKLAGCQVGEILPFPEFLESCEEQKLFAVVHTVMQIQLLLLKKEALEEVYLNKELAEKALFEDRSFLFLPLINKDDCYKKRLEDATQDLWDYCETKF